MALLTLGPLRISKRQWRPLWPAEPMHSIESDFEKQTPSSDFSDEESYDSETTRSTSLALLDYHGTRAASAYDDKIPRGKFNRYFTIVLGSLLVLFILTLATLGYRSNNGLLGHVLKPKPFAYEAFPFLKRYHGGIRNLVSKNDNNPEYPGDEEAWIQELSSKSPANRRFRAARGIGDDNHKDHNLPPMKPFDPFDVSSIRQECYLDDEGTQVPKLHAYDGCVDGMPDHVLGSYDMFGLRNDVCFDRYGRLGPYGYGYSQAWGGTGAGLDGEREGFEQVWAETPEVNYTRVQWAQAMSQCREKNKIQQGRSVVVIRTWHDYDYDPEDIIYLRSLISELALASGAEYDVHFLIHVRDNDLPIWSDEKEYQRVLDASLPEEFQGMGTLWSDPQLMSIYSGMDAHPFRDIHLHGAYRSTFMPMQYFASKHPEYEFFWHWEMDVRYTGHFYHLFDRISAWAKKQPRKGLWERNARFYVPAVHGSWEDFHHMVRVQTEHGTSSAANAWSSSTKSGPAAAYSAEKPIWGPEPPTDDISLDQDPLPPTSYTKDKYEWGVGEDADLITFNPLFDPEGTDWNLEKDVTGYNLTNGYPPRRVAIITASRLSRRLLSRMHEETSVRKHTMFSEMWPASCALHHGLKAVYAPHPEFIDRRWPTSYLAAVYNSGRNGASGGARTTAFNDAHQNNFLGITWYYHATFPVNLYRRWLGFKVDNDGGEEWERDNEGRMCLPAMLLHPVKQVDLVFEREEMGDATPGKSRR